MPGKSSETELAQESVSIRADDEQHEEAKAQKMEEAC